MTMFLRRLAADKVVLVCCVLALLWLSLALFAPWLAPYDPDAVEMGRRLQGVSAAHWMGTDSLGRDEFSRILYGARVTLSIAFLGVGITALFGIFIGSAIALLGGRAELAGTAVLDFFLAFPNRIFMIALLGVLGQSVGSVILALALTTWPEYARIARTLVRTEREKGYVRYAPFAGAGFFRVLFLYILPNALPQLLLFLCQHISEVILLVAGLSLIGIGIPPPSPEWGTLLMGAREYMQTAPHLLIFPGLAIFITVLIFNLLGDALRDFFDPYRAELTEKEDVHEPSI
ncbi:nickel ABC transporter permease subunit NikC [Selenomonas sp. TAMA-11512]|uniref:ABC transporter permease n=1 Tax=Selenomonas sp. TAMA-11512 TaxID=3095337 RepID=UPI00308CA745|nr:nickel ABC transporter permease subunit NikC [Selenomonas sp. TAMA-11512]